MNPEVLKLKEDVRRKAEKMAQEAIGARLAVRVGRNEVHRGTITKVEVLEPVFTGRTVCARWRA